MTQRFAGTCAVALSGLLASASALAQDIKIGFNADLSASPSALAGKAMVPGAEAAVEDINAAGGVLGRKLALVTRDDLGQPQKSMQNISELIDSEKVVAIIGPTNSGNAHTWKHIPNQKKIPDRRGSFRHLGHGADLGRRDQLHVSRLDGRPQLDRRADGRLRRRAAAERRDQAGQQHRGRENQGGA